MLVISRAAQGGWRRDHLLDLAGPGARSPGWRGARADPGWRDHERDQLARDFPGQRADRNPGDDRHAEASGRVTGAGGDAPDWTGFVLLTAGLISPVYGFTRVSGRGWGDSGVLGCLIGGCIVLVAFVIAAFAMNGSLFAMMLYLVLYLQHGAVASIALIRSRDFVQTSAPSGVSRPAEASA
jgi:hypothetical protein